MEQVTFDIGLVIVSSAVVAVISYSLKQPLILAYLIAGVAIGPFGFGLIQDPEFIQGTANIGIILMLFLVGLEMSVPRLKELGFVSLLGGIGQVVLTGIIGILLVKIFGFRTIQSLYISVALTFSSTVIAVKILSDKRDTHSLYGQISIGILIIQDVLAILALLLLAGFQEGGFGFDIWHFSGIFVRGILLAIMTMLISKKILKYLYNVIASSHELLVLFSLSWCFVISLLSLKIGFSMEIGAFIAGISLANLPYTFEINAKTKVLRDFFITIFFAALGAKMIFSGATNLLFPLIVLSIFVLIGKPLLVVLLMGVMGYDKRTAFFTGLILANISEFSLVIIALGNRLGHLSEEITSMIALIGMGTMVLSSYMMTYNNALYNFLKPVLSYFEFRKPKNVGKMKKALAHHIILFGCGQVGEQVLEQILGFKDDYIVVDHDNHVIRKLITKKINCMFGDAEDAELLENLNLEDAEVIISTLPNIEDNFFILRYIERLKLKQKPIIIATADSGRDGIEIFNKGVDYVILKPYLGASHIHHINKEIYELEKEFQHVPLSEQISFDKHLSDNEIALFLHNLNKLRLKEIIEKIEAKKIVMSSKKRL
ncbi:cation:proton antiporter [Candidatus Peregrinibacteria bacterium]|nr:cation:proton antiporter [Candidatus Peregrinibacteria bacterium]